MALFSYQPPAYSADADIKVQVRELYRQNRLLSEQLSYMFATLDDSNMTEGTRRILRSAQSAQAGMGKALSLLEDKVDGKVTTYYGDTVPTGAAMGDLWFDTGTGKRLYRWNGTQWQQTDDERIMQALSAAGDAKATADGKIVTFAQPEEPEGMAEGDLWINTGDFNSLNRWNGAEWEEVRDTYADGVLDGHAEVLASLGLSVGRKVTIYYQQEAPEAMSQGDVWYDMGASPVRIRRWDGWELKDITEAALGAALEAAGNAKAIADKKVVTFAQPDAPEGAGEGDLWINTAEYNTVYRWNSETEQWKKVRYGYVDTYIQNKPEGLEVGEVNVRYSAMLTPAGLVFHENGETVLGEFANNRMFTHRAAIADKLTLGTAGMKYYDAVMSFRRLTVKYREG